MNKKDLIVISAYCPTKSKQKKLSDLIDKLDNIRDKFDVIVVSHSPIKNKIQKKLDHFYYDKKNPLSDDLDLRYLGWFRNEDFFIESSLVYGKTTSIAIARSLRYSINFANFWNYKKVHYMEYDFVYPGDGFILRNNKLLDEYNTVMMRHPKNFSLLASSVYYCFNTEGLDEESKVFDESKFIEFVKNSSYDKFEVGQGIWVTNHARMTENLIPIMFAKNGRKTKFLPSMMVDQTEDSHDNDEMKWVFPVYDKDSDSIFLFTHNTTNQDFTSKVQLNEETLYEFHCKPYCWRLDFLDKFEGEKTIKIWSQNKLLKEVEINNSNKEKFIRNSYIIHEK